MDITNLQSENKGCQYENCGKPTFSKRIEGKKYWKLTCPTHENMLGEVAPQDNTLHNAIEVFNRIDTPVIKPEPTLSELEAQMLELQAKIEEAKRIEEERIRLEELKKPITIAIQDINNYDGIVISLDKTNDLVLDVLRNTRGRVYESFTKTNVIPVSSWLTFIEEINKLDNIKFKNENKLQEIEQYINEVDVNVDDNGKEFVLTIARRRKYWAITQISSKLPGSKEVQPTREIKNWRVNVPLSEGWRIASVLDESKKFRYIETYNISEHSMAIINDQIESRNKLDGAAQLLDVENFPELNLNGQTLYPFQKVGVRFACLALGLGDIAK